MKLRVLNGEGSRGPLPHGHGSEPRASASGTIVPVLLAVLCTGCTVGPNYQRPAVSIPAAFRAPEPLPPTQGDSLGNTKWFEVFKDEQLQSLDPHGARAQLRSPGCGDPGGSGAGQSRHYALEPVPELRRRGRSRHQPALARWSHARCLPHSCRRRIATSARRP